jgi:hypothetical protein
MPSNAHKTTLDRRYVFVCGLHRSGTSLLARALAEHPAASGFQDTGAIEDEGQFLQTVLPVENVFGGVGRFGFDPRAHMTEESALNNPQAASRILAEWSRYWDMEKPVLIEKTPSNLLRMRLLQELFPASYFVVITRHPVACSLASLKWAEGNLFSLLTHWVHCYRIAKRDSALVKRVLWMSYEGFVADPQREMARVARFVELSPYPVRTTKLRDDNPKYFQHWRTHCLGDANRGIEQIAPEQKRSLTTRLRDRLRRDARERALPAYRKRANRRNFYDAQDAVALLEPALAEFGYSFVDLDRVPAIRREETPPIGSPVP